MKTLSAQDIKALRQTAQTSPRQRAHLNIHTSLDAPIQRLFIVLQPDTYVRPHQHSEDHKWELILLVEGAASVLILDAAGQLLERVELCTDGTRMLELPPYTWHTLVAQAPDTLVFEVKEGPYTPASDKDFGAWAPQEGNAACAAHLAWWREAPVGSSLVLP